MATANVPRTVTFGPLNSGLATSVIYTILDSTGTVRIGPTTGTGVTEMTDASGNATTGSYAITFAIDPAWLPCIERYAIAGKPGIGVQGTFGLEAMPTSIDNTGKPVLQSGSISSSTFASGAITNNAVAPNLTISTVTTVGSVTGAVGSVLGNVGGNVVGSVASVASAVTVGANNDKSGYVLSNVEHQNIQTDCGSALLSHDALPVPIRTQDNVAAPTYADAALGAWSVAFAAQVDNTSAIPPQFVIYKPGGAASGAARTYNLTNNSTGQPVARS